MTENKIILKKVTTEEKKVLLLLDKLGKCLYGNIFKELKIAPSTGAEIILLLKNKGFIKNVNRTSYYELDGSIV